MKKTFCNLGLVVFILFLSSSLLFADEAAVDALPQKVEENGTLEKKPKTDYEEKKETLQYGLTTEVIELIKSLEADKDTRFNSDLVELFRFEKNIKLKIGILSFFSALDDGSIKNEVGEILNNYDKYNNELLKSCIQYCAKLKIGDQSVKDGLRSIIDENKTDLKEMAILALGNIGNGDDANYLVEAFDLEDETDNDSKLSLIFRQAIMQALIELKELDTVDFLKERALDTYENTIIRARGITALGKIGKAGGSDIIDILADSFEETDPIIREAVVAGLASFEGDAVAYRLILQAFKDEYYKVRLKAIEVSAEMMSAETIPLLFYRAKNDPEQSIKNAAIEALGKFGNAETDEWLCETFNDTKVNNDTRIKVGMALLKNKPDLIVASIEREILTSINDRLKKQFVYNLGKQLSAYKHAGLVNVAETFLRNSDASLKSIGLDMFKTNYFSELVSLVQEIAEDKKSGALQKRAQQLLESAPSNSKTSTDELMGEVAAGETITSDTMQSDETSMDELE